MIGNLYPKIDLEINEKMKKCVSVSFDVYNA